MVMDPFLAGFADELVKLAAQPLEIDPGMNDYSSSIAKAMSEYSGANAKSGLKGDPKVHPPLARRPIPPHPMTTPNQMVGLLGSE